MLQQTLSMFLFFKTHFNMQLLVYKKGYLKFQIIIFSVSATIITYFTFP